MTDSTLPEDRIKTWNRVPDGSLLHIRVSEGEYAVTGEGVLRIPGQGVTNLLLSFEHLVRRDFVVPITAGAFFRLIVTITYLRPEIATATVTASVVKPDGTTHQRSFRCDYRGSLGGVSPEDEVILAAMGEDP
jgi:hypothetical protein